jgi:outer membrane protein assembly factor BamD
VTASGLDIEIPVETIARDRNLYVAALENALLGCPIAARMQFQTLFTTFPDSEFADAAKYQLAESYYRDGSPAAMTSAMREFAEYLRFFPNAPRTEEARQRLLEIQQKLR